MHLEWDGDTRDAFSDSHARFQAGRMGMWLFLITLGILFASTIFAFVVVRLQPDPATGWRPTDEPGIPGILLISTAVLLASSWTLTRASAAIVGDQRRQGRQWIERSLILGSLFLVLQAVGWIDMWRAGVYIDSSLYGWTFYVLTGLHAVHVLGGLIPMGVVAARARRGTYSRLSHSGLTYCSMYWHFLAGVWIVLYLTLWLGSM